MKRIGRIAALLLLAGTVGCDRVTKYLAVTNLADAQPRSYLSDTLRLEYAENVGAFLSLGSALPHWARTGLLQFGVGVALAVLAAVAFRYQWEGLRLTGAVLVFAGGSSNLLDRIANGYVVDFMNVGVGSLRTGIFNVADVAILAGGALIALTAGGSKANSAG